MKNVQLKALVMGCSDPLILDSFQTYDAWKRAGKKVRRGEKACCRIPMYRPCKYEKEDEKTWEVEEKTFFHIQLVSIFHEWQLEGNEWKKLDSLIIQKVNDFIKKHWLVEENKDLWKENIHAFEKRCKQYDENSWEVTVWELDMKAVDKVEIVEDEKIEALEEVQIDKVEMVENAESKKVGVDIDFW